MSTSQQQMIKAPILLGELLQYDVIDKVVIESLEQSLYRLEVEIDGNIFYVVEEHRSEKKILTRRSIIDIQTLLIPFSITCMWLKHTSAYDEMIGHEVSAHHNELLVPLGDYFENEKKAVKH